MKCSSQEQQSNPCSSIFSIWTVTLICTIWSGLVIAQPGSFGTNRSNSDSSPLKTHTEWQRLPGKATDISIGANGEAWAIGTDEREGGFGIYRWDEDNWERQEGGAIRIAVGINGIPWVINSEQEIYRWDNGSWARLPGQATDIAIGGDGSVWVTGAGERDEVDFNIFKFNGESWDRTGGAGISIAVDSNGNPWITNSEGSIYQNTDDDWTRLTGEGLDIAIGHTSNSAWVVGTREVSGGYSVFHLQGNEWQRVDGGAVRIAVDNFGLPWIINAEGDIYRSL